MCLLEFLALRRPSMFLLSADGKLEINKSKLGSHFVLRLGPLAPWEL